jgi:putative acetyltransferase
VTIREANISDLDSIRETHLAAFGDDEKFLVADLAVELLARASDDDVLNLVAEDDDRIVGHVSFSPINSKSDGTRLGRILAPLATVPDRQRKGIGSSLVQEGVYRLKALDTPIVFVYGDPDYYGKFGFASDEAIDYVPSYELTYPNGWLAVRLAGKKPANGSEEIECVKALEKPELW